MTKTKRKIPYSRIICTGDRDIREIRYDFKIIVINKSRKEMTK